MAHLLPKHLQKYVVTQDYDKYTAEDHSVWRYCLRQLRNFLSTNGHECYLEGLKKTGITIERIPKISEVSESLEKFGWRALPVSGFIPPAAFMEMQSLGVLPVASDMRTVDHLLYTPAPDIVHEAAGHAPIIVDPEYADYLKQYSQIAKNAIISKEDLDLYEAIRTLSDVKESASSSKEDIEKAEKGLQTAISSVTHVSEATQLSRMNWWTAEYGLIGDVKNPKIYGAGLLSSVGESKWCLSDNVKKIPLTIDCINQTYDITEPQPQLFVTPDFKTLVTVLHELSETMAYKTGGTKALDKLIQAKSVNTVVLDSGLQISSVLAEYFVNDKAEPIFLKFSEPTQISFKNKELEGHNTKYHQHGYSSPLGDFESDNFVVGKPTHFKYKSGFEIRGILTQVNKISDKAIIYTFDQATATYQGKTYFEPAWGSYDVVTGSKVISAFGGPADRPSYGDIDDFQALKVPAPVYSDYKKKVFSLYKTLKGFRTEGVSSNNAAKFFNEALETASEEWLVFMELLEIGEKNKFTELNSLILNHLKKLMTEQPNLKTVIEDGISLSHAQD